MSLKNITKYELLETREINDIKVVGHRLKHIKSGARIVLLENDDENKVFNIGFRTPPSDSTGLPHILEHSVLCGSKNFPLKDPFVELVKGSLNTFLNAMTYPDKTVYPVASCNDKDFQNLMHVYMDAVFYPNIYSYEEIFRQEGWSYNLENKEAELTYNGVVYNEMKGAFSSPDSVIDRMILNSLFPDTTYSHESGGDPDVIPELTYEQFLEFHSKYYHPSNSYIYLYGNMDMCEKLEWLDKEYLSNFDEIEVKSEIDLQQPFEKVIYQEASYSIGSNEEEKDNTYLSWNKVVGTSLDSELSMAFQVIDYALLSAPGAPLKKALNDAGIGKDILGSYDDGILQPMISVVAKGANVEQCDEFIGIIEDTLKSIVENGVDRKALEAGINYNEFNFREGDYGRYPRGLMYGLELFGSWLYQENKPFIYIELLEVFQNLRAKIDTNYFEELIKTYLLDNQHGSIVVLKPEKGRTARQEQELKQELASYKESLSDTEVDELVSNTNGLLEYQDTPSREEDIKKIPVLQRSDISKEIRTSSNEEIMLGETLLLHHNIETNGVGYLNLLFDVQKIPDELISYVGLLNACMGMVDTKSYKYGELFNEINVHTGGIMSAVEVYPDVTKVQQKSYQATFEIKTKCLYNKLPVAIELMLEMMNSSQFQDTKRMKEILDMLQSRLQSRFVSAGHTTAVLRAASYGSVLSKFKDLTSGIGFYDFVVSLNKDFEIKKCDIVESLNKLVQLIFNEENMMISYTASTEGMIGMESIVDKLKHSLKKEDLATIPYSLEVQKINEGIKTASKVQYVSTTGNFIDKGLPYHGALLVLKVILSYEYLWQNVRVKGGAYGCMSGFNRIGEGYFASYRDPNLKETIGIYDGVVSYLENFQVSEEELTKYVIGAMSDLDQPLTPSAQGDRALNLFMNKVSDDMLIRERNEILATSNEDIRAMAKVVSAVLSHNQLCVIGGEDKIEENKELFQVIRNLL